MKKAFIFSVLFFICITLVAQPSSKMRVRINLNFSGSDIAYSLAEGMQGALFNELKLAYPCLSFVDDELIRVGLDQNRQMQLVGAGDNERLNEFSKNTMDVDYYLFITCTVTTEELASVTAVFRDAKHGFNDLSSVYFNGDARELLNDSKALRDNAKKMSDRLANYEICPYRGPIKIEVKSDKEVKENNAYPVYCNGQDRQFRRVFTESKHSTNIWSFDKSTRVYAKTSVDYSIDEKRETIIEDGCYECPTGKTQRYIRETITKTGKIDKVSQESQLFGKRINDSRINISFNDNGTYMIKVEAATDQSEITTTINRHAESWCDQSEPIKTVKNKTDMGLTYIFGPYQGKPSDETLSLSPTSFTKIDPVNNEKTTYTINFNLKKDL